MSVPNNSEQNLQPTKPNQFEQTNADHTLQPTSANLTQSINTHTPNQLNELNHPSPRISSQHSLPPYCLHQTLLDDPSLIACSSPKLIHSGIISSSICHRCPYRNETKTEGLGTILSTALSAVGITKDKVSHLTRIAGLGDCGCEGRAQWLNHNIKLPSFLSSVTSSTIQFIWPYWHAGRKSDELRWSIRSVEKNFQGKFTPLVVGDCPDWYTGFHIQVNRIKNMPLRSFRDMLNKMLVISSHELVHEQFVWMMDDIYFIQPFQLETLFIRRPAGKLNPGRGGWQQLKRASKTILEELGLPTFDYATHLPHYVEKDKLHEMFSNFPPSKITYLWEILFNNIYQPELFNVHMPLFPFMYRFDSKDKLPTTGKTRLSTVVNHSDTAWSQSFREYLQRKFSSPSKYESKKMSPVTKKPQPTQYMLFVESHYGPETIKPVNYTKGSDDPRLQTLPFVTTCSPASTPPESLTAPTVSTAQPTPPPATSSVPEPALASYPSLSTYRLNITKVTLIPSLLAQTRQEGTIVVAIHPNDPLLQERMELYKSIENHTSFSVNFVEWDDTAPHSCWPAHPDERVLIGRCDDDDLLPKDFVQTSLFSAEHGGDTPFCVVWPNGYSFHEGKPYSFNHPGNQFVALCTHNSNNNEYHPHQRDHRIYNSKWKTIIASNDFGWCWVRHSSTISITRKRYRTRNMRMDTERFPYNFRAIHRESVAGMTLDQIALLHGTDKASTANNYTGIYTALFERKRFEPLHILELGVFKGASVKMWCDYFPNATVVGVDKDKIPFLKYPRYTHIQHKLSNSDSYDKLMLKLPDKFDIIIDDMSHESEDIMLAAKHLYQMLKPNGIYIAEDVYLHQAAAFKSFAVDSTDWLCAFADKLAIRVGN